MEASDEAAISGAGCVLGGATAVQLYRTSPVTHGEEHKVAPPDSECAAPGLAGSVSAESMLWLDCAIRHNGEITKADRDEIQGSGSLMQTRLAPKKGSQDRQG